jgi:hypothetical protein
MSDLIEKNNNLIKLANDVNEIGDFNCALNPLISIPTNIYPRVP